MRKIFLFLKFFVIFLIGWIFFFCFSGPSFAQSSIKFKEVYYDFGEIEAHKPLIHNFEYENTGKDALTITKVKSGCNCRGKNLAGRKLQPGEKGKIEVLYRPSPDMEGRQERRVLVHSNDPDFPIIKLTVLAKIGKNPP